MDIIENNVKNKINEKIDLIKQLLDIGEKVDIFDEINSLLNYDNKEFAFKSIEIFKPYINSEVLNVLTTEELCKTHTKHLRPILIDVTQSVLDNSKINTLDDNGKSRYYPEYIDINGKFYIISNDWYYETKRGYQNRIPYLEYIKEIIKKNENRVNGGENIIYYGVPGTGKSHKIDEILEQVKDENKFRITFHPEYTYNDFVGQLLPTIIKEGEQKGDITYDFQKGPFTLALEKAYNTPGENVYLIIEEMSRGNCAAIFGDIFQLLDRIKERENKDWSRYFVNNEIIARDITRISNGKIKIPSNLSIMGTVNTSDQNVFVMDTAFKRRFEWKYISTKPVIEKPYLNNVELSFNNGRETIKVNWVDLYGILNKFISSSERLGLGEDKQIGQFLLNLVKITIKKKLKTNYYTICGLTYNKQHTKQK